MAETVVHGCVHVVLVDDGVSDCLVARPESASVIVTEVDIMTLVERIAQTREALLAAHDARQVARAALSAAERVAFEASTDFQAAQNALLAAAGGTSLMLDLPQLRS